MGGNKRFRTATYVDSQGNRHTVKDRNGNNIEVPEYNGVSRTKRTNTTAANARERMLNAQAVKEVRDLAKVIRKSGSVKIGQYTWNASKVSDEELKKSTDAAYKLADLANQIKPGSVDAFYDQNATKREIIQAFSDMQKILGVRF